MLWENNLVPIDVINTSSQCIHMSISFKDGQEKCFLTCVYGSPIPSTRQDLWSQLENISNLIGQLKWMCLGDFNAYKSVDDKHGGARPNIKSMTDFNNCCTNCNLMALKLCGPRFTWKNKSIQERLDWALANFNWFTHFNEAYNEHLNWFKSNHRLVLVRMGSEDPCRRTPSRFRFMASWATDSSFKDLIKHSWDNSKEWPEAISSLKGKISEWNNTVFGNIHRRKKSLLNRLSGIDRSDPMGSNPFLIQLHDTLWREYEKTLLQEEIFWCQRVRHKWIHFGDRNTKFFHASTLIRKKRNKVEALRDERGNWIMDKDMASQFLKNLYSEDEIVISNSFPIKSAFPSLNPTCMGSMDAEVTSEEIKDALFSMGALKAPGPDGLHAMFFQSQWDTLGASVCKFIKSCFLDPRKIDNINDTDVILIPKKDNPDNLKHFRLIALCNVIYKTITKIIANRLKPLLRDLISPTQCSFVPGRHSSDNVIIAQEIIHSMVNKKAKKRFHGHKS